LSWRKNNVNGFASFLLLGLNTARYSDWERTLGPLYPVSASHFTDQEVDLDDIHCFYKEGKHEWKDHSQILKVRTYGQEQCCGREEKANPVNAFVFVIRCHLNK
jgi:hypothetical protein